MKHLRLLLLTPSLFALTAQAQDEIGFKNGVVDLNTANFDVKLIKTQVLLHLSDQLEATLISSPTTTFCCTAASKMGATIGATSPSGIVSAVEEIGRMATRPRNELR